MTIHNIKEFIRHCSYRRSHDSFIDDALAIAKELLERRTQIEEFTLCLDCEYWEGSEGGMGLCNRLLDDSIVQISVGEHRLITADNFGCSAGKPSE